MSKPVRLVREARAELHEAARRYGEKRPELRIEFLAAVDEARERMVRLAKHLAPRRASIPPSASCVSGAESPADPVLAELEAALAMRRTGADAKALRRALRRIEELLDE